VVVEGHDLAADGAGRRIHEQPAPHVATANPEVQHCSGQPAMHLVGIVFEADDQNPAALENMIAGQRSAGCQRKQLRKA
jgi:hypothetical protein